MIEASNNVIKGDRGKIWILKNYFPWIFIEIWYYFDQNIIIYLNSSEITWYLIQSRRNSELRPKININLTWYQETDRGNTLIISKHQNTGISIISKRLKTALHRLFGLGGTSGYSPPEWDRGTAVIPTRPLSCHGGDRFLWFRDRFMRSVLLHLLVHGGTTF